MASAWGSSWGSAWGVSWGDNAAPAVVASGGLRRFTKIRLYFPIYTDEEEKPVTVVKPKVQRRIVRRAVVAFDPRTPPLPDLRYREAERAVRQESKFVPPNDPALKALITEVLRLAFNKEIEDDDEEVLVLI